MSLKVMELPMGVYAHTNKKDIHSIGNAMADKLAYDSVINN